MTHEEKILYFTSALNICKFGFTEAQVDLMVSLYDKILETKGETSLQDIAKVKAQNLGRFPKETESIQ